LSLRIEPLSKELRQPIRIDPNERFAHIEDFMRAQQEAREARERTEARARDARRRLAIDPETTAREIQQLILDEMCSNSNLDLYQYM